MLIAATLNSIQVFLYIGKFKFRVIALIFYLITSVCYAQNVDKSTGDYRNNKWEVGIDLLPLIGKSKDQAGFITKRLFKTPTGINALRFRVNPSLTFSPYQNLKYGSYIGNFRTALGYEKQKLYNPFILLYGVELIYNFSYYNGNLPSPNLLNTQRSTYAGISGLFGGKYLITDNISITMESHLQCFLQRLTTSSSLAFTKIQTYNMALSPIQMVYLSYHF